jgi:hypothetical protein
VRQGRRRYGMAEETSSGTGTPGEATFTIVPVPEDQVEEVMEFVAGLKNKDTDVSGHMISGGILGGFGGGLSAKQSTQSNCVQTFTKGTTGYDWSCTDTDTINT